MRPLCCAILVIFLCPVIGYSQTCCTGGAPLVGTINLQNPDAGKLSLSISYDLNKIEDFFQENDKLNDDFIRRRTKTLFAQVDYAFNDKISVTMLLPYVWLSESIDQPGSIEKNSTDNLGDVTVFGQYQVLKKDGLSAGFGLGVKLPTGETKGRDAESQFILPPTMQSGTGSVDYLALAQVTARLPFRKSVTITQAFYYKLNGDSHRFTFHDRYRFGNEFQSISAFSDQLLIANMLNYPSLTLRVRTTTKDRVDNYDNPNTGGIWAYIAPGWTLQLLPEVKASVRYEIPFLRRLKGFQITTTQRINVSVNVII
ncbi:transporter [Fulvivirgaceae bacterium BMA12]|uniref:Transporter n=1 Tax=Agaribacillus aureus TaxID=3051825 RepID=A0ABT8L9P3_9BACT|nr:transporter [Fulvivirgaceae bacterium BMA12]